MVGDAAWYAFLSDIFATLVAVGVGMAFFIRKVLKPDRFRGSHMQEADRMRSRSSRSSSRCSSGTRRGSPSA